jgi:hypothetical protein
VWAQSVTRTRWLATKLGVTALVSAVAVGALGLAVTWWAEPIDGAVGSTRGALPARLTPVSFAMRGVVPVGYTVFCLVLGVTLGAVLRRTLPAMALTMALFVAVQIALPLWVRPHLAPPIEVSVTLRRGTLDGIRADGSGRPVSLTAHTGSRDDWVLSNATLDARGQAAALPSWLGDCLAAPPPTSLSPRQAAAPPVSDCLARLTAEGYTQRVVYQPAARFWRLQWMETALFLALAGLLAGLCLWWTRTRLA